MISVFNNSRKPGMFQRISDIVRAEAKTLDCFSRKAQQTMEVFDSARWNDFGQELLKTKGGIAEGETLNVDTDKGTTLSTNKNEEDTRVVKDGDTYKMYVYQNGEKVAVELSEAEYEGLAKTTDKYY